jgi:CRISPR-associated protein Csy1
MVGSEQSSPSRDSFRTAIAAFIEARHDAKLKGKESDTDTASKYDYETWLADAARRVGQIQAVTHVLKATHPDAKGSSLHIPPNSLPARTEIGTHVLGEDYAEDIVGNAAALDVFKFLKLEIAGRRLLDWMQAGNPDLRQALHPDPAVADAWMAAFRGLVRQNQQWASHEAAKQVYWCIGESPSDDAHYHLLQPLPSSSLTHAIHTDIKEARFGEANKIARQAYREKAAFQDTYRDYRGLVARKLGGTKPQNISQLNSERGGINYLLASLPPAWERANPKSLLSRDSAMDRFGYFEDVPKLIKALSTFLLSDPEKTMQTRIRREAIEQELGQQLPLFSAYIQVQFDPGWTRDSDCLLPLYEQIWLDPERIELPSREDHFEEDEAFKQAYVYGDWCDEVAARFANWVNASLYAAGLTTVGDAEYKHWAKQALIDTEWPIPMQRRAGGEA